MSHEDDDTDGQDDTDGHGHSHGRDHHHHHEGHGHSHDHGHAHDPHEGVTADDPRPRARALQSLLIEKGLVSTDAIDEAITAYEREIGPLNGARVVARAWTDEAFRERLLDDADAAIAEFDFDVGVQHIEVKENTPRTHNAVVCTLCSCYPWSLLGLPPTWYKTPAYRSRMVREPRSVLAEFGVDLDDDTEVRVWDSSSEIRYMVLPRRPSGTEGMDEAELREVVTRDAMIGVERLDGAGVAAGD
jgi:nitrile hydratase alpha subunit